MQTMDRKYLPSDPSVRGYLTKVAALVQQMNPDATKDDFFDLVLKMIETVEDDYRVEL